MIDIRNIDVISDSTLEDLSDCDQLNTFGGWFLWKPWRPRFFPFRWRPRPQRPWFPRYWA